MLSTLFRSIGCASTVGAIALALCPAACEKAGPQSSPAGSAHALPSAPVASTPPAKVDPPAPDTGVFPPELWERAWNDALGPDPVMCGDTSSADQLRSSTGCKDRVELPHAACSNVDARKLLRDRHQEDYARRKVERQKAAARREKEEAAIWLPRKQAWLERKKELKARFQAGVFPKLPPAAARQPVAYGAVGTSVALGPVEAPGPLLDAFRANLALHPRWSDSFECEVKNAARIPKRLDPREAELSRVRGAEPPTASQTDVLTCWHALPTGSYGLAIVFELPTSPVSATVAVNGDEGKIEGYDALPPVLDEALRAKFVDGEPAALAGQRIRVSGIRRLQRFDHGAIAYKYLSEHGYPKQMAIRTAEYKHVWIATFDRACADKVAGCPTDDGLPAARVELLSPAAPVAAVAAGGGGADPPAPVEGRRAEGLWQDVANAVDPDGKQSRTWAAGFWPRPVDGAATLSTLPAPGKAARVETPSDRSNEAVTAYQAELAARGGIKPFLCSVEEIGQEPNPPASAVLDAAASAAGVTPDVATQYQILCRGDQDSFLGPIVLLVPSYAAWADVTREGDDATVARYHLQKHGWFDDWLGNSLPASVGLADQGATGTILDRAAELGPAARGLHGTVLRVNAVSRLARKPDSNIVFGADRGTVWYATLAKMQCPHAGLGCAAQDGIKPPAIETVRGVPCDPAKFTYPPESGAVTESIAD